MRTRITPPLPRSTTGSTARSTAALAAGAACLLLLTACGSPSSASDPSSAPTAATGKNGDAPPKALAGTADIPRVPVPRGKGSRTADDFNGDGNRDLVIDDLVKAPQDSHGDDVGIGVVYGSGDGGLDPAARQLLSARTHAAKSGDTLPVAFDAQAACDLDADGFTDLVVATDPPYNGIGRPPIPLQVLFGSPEGLTGKAVTLRIPDRARFGNEWPDHPVCGDFDGDDRTDLAVTAGEGRISYLRGPFTRAGAPRAAASLPGGGPYLAAPEPRADTNGDGYDDLVHSAKPLRPGTAATATLLLGSATGPARPGGTYRVKAPAHGVPTAPVRSGSGPTETTLLRYADFDGDKKPDTAVRTYRGEETDLIALYPSTTPDRPRLTFSTALFLP
ncbi:VCBS repeat-containing protein [Streptomyces finlayi]|uniref:VCBS repeat-containing protein n=1 Tax=Streptomyces finlayi TaxID=67296 RepID=A0A7G7BM39_9ACTN|nr:VCBS repeat-containing protein [Streptomyces finlayi]QNE76404.1 VCBS repeat-containing protein [Streptomyces finlayi]